MPAGFAGGAYIRTEDYVTHSGNPTNDLNETLLASWPLATNGNESLGNYNLSDFGGVTYSSNAAVFNGTAKYLYHSSLDLIKPANNSFSIWAQVTLSSTAASGVICSQYGAAGTRQWRLMYEQAYTTFVLWIYNSTDTGFGIAWSSTVTTGTTYHIAAWYDAAAGKVYISVNDGTPAIQSNPGFVIRQTTTSDFRIGASAESGAEQYYNGTVRRVRLFQGWCLTAEQRSALYNAGNGIDYPFSAGTAPAFTSGGAVMAASVHDLTISGSDTRGYVNDTTTYDIGRADEYDCINSYSHNAHHYNLLIDNFRGTALRIGKGSVVISGERLRYDHEVTWADNIQFQKCYRGIRLDTIDCKLTRVSGQTFRDYGIWVPASAAQIETVHLYGGDIGLWLGGKPLSGESFCSDIEVENCRIGLWADAQNSVVNLFRSFDCFSRNALLTEGCQLNDVMITVRAEDGTYTDIAGVEIQTNGKQSRVNGVINIEGTSTGIKLGAHQCTIDVQGDILAAGTGIEITAGVDDCDISINVYSSNASAVALNITALGTGNRIRVNTRNGSFTNPVLYPGGGTTYNLSASNELYLNGVPQHGIGYSAGVGGSVTQTTSKSTSVTINKIVGMIGMHNAALASGAEITFVVNNSTVAYTDVVIINHGSAGTPGAYVVQISEVGNGGFKVTVGNVSAGSLSEAIVLNYAVIKGANS